MSLYLVLFLFGVFGVSTGYKCTTCSPCYNLTNAFMWDLLRSNPGYHLLSSNVSEDLSARCGKIAKCPIDDDYIAVMKISIFPIFHREFCPIIDLVKEQLGSCFDKLISHLSTDNRYKLMNCVWKSIDFNNVTKDTPWIGPNDPRPDYSDFAPKYSVNEQTCRSLYQNCSLSMIDDVCGAKFSKILLENRGIMEDGNCSGAEPFEHDQWTQFVLGKLKENNGNGKENQGGKGKSVSFWTLVNQLAFT